MATLMRVVVSVLFVVTCCICTVMAADAADADSRDILYRYLREQRQKPIETNCRASEESCMPGHDNCCQGYACRNKFGHMCLYPLEACYCFRH